MQNNLDITVASILSNLLERKIYPGESILFLNEPQWHSLKMIELVYMLEEAFDIKIAKDHILDLKGSDDIISLVKTLRR